MRHIEDAESEALWQWAQHVSVLRDHLIHIPNGGKRNAREAARFKRMGVRPGVHDYHLPVPRGDWHGLWIELKAPPGRRSSVSAAQREWGDKMRTQGYAVAFCKGWLEARDVLEWYINLPKPAICVFTGDSYPINQAQSQDE